MIMNINFSAPNIVTNPPIPPMIQKQISEDERKKQEFDLLVEQNIQLKANFKKLEELCNMKDTELKEAKQGEKKAKVYNTVMMVITIISMLVAVAAWLVPNVLEGGA